MPDISWIGAAQPARACPLRDASPDAPHRAPRCEPMCGRNTDRTEILWARAAQESILSRDYDVSPFRIYILLSTFEKHARRQLSGRRLL